MTATMPRECRRLIVKAYFLLSVRRGRVIGESRDDCTPTAGVEITRITKDQFRASDPL